MEVVVDCVSFKCNNKVIIDNVSFCVGSGITCVIGECGSGKSTLLSLVSGVLRPSSGKYIINGINSLNRGIRRDVGVVFQFPEEQFFSKDVYDEVKYALDNFKLDKNLVYDIFDRMNLDKSLLKRKLSSLSSGEARMIAIASILVYNPKVVFFDEPTVGLDMENKKKLIDLIISLKREGKIIFIVSHDIDLLYKISDNVIGLSNGKLVINSKKEDAFNDLKLLIDNNIPIPKIVLFETLVKYKKNIKLMHTYSINDLIKEVYRNV